MLKFNDILFAKRIDSMKNKESREFLQEFLKLKNLLIRILLITLVTVICGLAFFILRAQSLENEWNVVVFNKGIAWSWGNNWDQWVVYVIKLIPTAILLGCSFSFNQRYLYVPLYIAGINSLFNVIDKGMVDVYAGQSYYDTVVDNIPWNNLGFTNNIADIFIILSFVWVILGIIYYIYDTHKKEKAKEKSEAVNETTNNSPS